MENDKRNIREHFETEIARLETEVDRQNSKLQVLRENLKDARNAEKETAKKQQDLTNQLVSRLSKLIQMYEQKEVDYDNLKKKLISKRYS